jgi:hypothetical protein
MLGRDDRDRRPRERDLADRRRHRRMELVVGEEDVDRILVPGELGLVVASDSLRVDRDLDPERRERAPDLWPSLHSDEDVDVDVDRLPRCSIEPERERPADGMRDRGGVERAVQGDDLLRRDDRA